MILSNLDWAIIAAFFAISLIIGLWVSKRAGSNTTEFFLSGRNMPWWLLGISMVATTFSTDTPNLVADLVRQKGVSGNWDWWAFLMTGMLTVFVYAKLWRRSQVMTDIEFYELRYSGPAARFLRGFRALYLGLIFNTLVIGSVALAAIKFGEVVLGIPGWQILLVAGSITLVYSAMGGLKAVIITDFILFVLAMIGSIWAAIYILGLDQVGGLGNLLSQENVQAKMDILPDFNNPQSWIPILFVPLAVQWWASYYPGAEPGGGGYIAQRMFSAKNERNAIGATLLFNIAHYALRPWPWILIALASLVVFPEVADIQTAFPNLSADKLGHDVAYPAMLTFLPSGLLGLVAASLIAAFMSTMSTQLNLGASYLVNDFYKRFVKPEADEKELVWAGRLFTVVSTVLGLGLGLMLTSAKQAFDLLLLLGAGTGMIYILRWFWWRINAYTEIVAMVASLFIAGYLTFGFTEPADTVIIAGNEVKVFVYKLFGTELFQLYGWEKIVYGAILTTIIWVVATFFTPPDEDETLRSFYQKIRPGGPGWNAVVEKAEAEGVPMRKHPGQLPLEILSMIIGVFTVYSALFATGFWIYGQTSNGILFTCLTILGAAFLFRNFNRIKADEELE